MNQLASKDDRRYLYLTVFAAGMATLAVEFTTSRMLQAVYGTSNIVWANVIGLVLLFLTLGYFLGGWLADKRPEQNTFYLLVSTAGLSSVVFLLLTSVILRTAASALAAVDVGAVLSSLVAVVLALAAPVTLLGCVSPFAIRLAVVDIGQAGRISGRVYALSTLGSLLGTYLPVLIVIPQLGSRVAAILFGSLLLMIGLIGLWRQKRSLASSMTIMSLALLPAAIIFSEGRIKTYEGQIFETESAYNYIQVVRQDECNYLLLNEGQAYHSYYCDGSRVPRVSVWTIMLASPYFRNLEHDTRLRRVAVIGLAAGTIPKQITQAYGEIPIDGIELDPAIVEAGQTYFALDEANINIIVGDGRYQFNRLDGPYDLVTLDAYKVPYIPWHLTTREYFQEIEQKLAVDGLLAINVGRTPGDRRLVEAVTATLLTVFPTVHTIDVPGSLNSILVATPEVTSPVNIISRLDDLDAEQMPLLHAAVQTAADNIVTSKSSDMMFTDERAPVETLIDSIVIRYLLREGPTGLPGSGG